MTDRKLLPVVAAVFLVTASLAGGATVAVLSDRATVTTVITVGTGVGNGTSGAGNLSLSAMTVTANTSESGSVSEPTTTTASGNDTGNTSEVGNVTVNSTPADGEGSGISISLQPANQTAVPGEERTYEIVVTGATDGIGAYDLTVRLSDPSVATFENFTHEHDPQVHEERLSGDELDVSGGMIEAIPGNDTIVLGTVTVTGNASGRTDLTIVSGTDSPIKGGIVDGNLTDPARYEVGATHSGVLIVRDGE